MAVPTLLLRPLKVSHTSMLAPDKAVPISWGDVALVMLSPCMPVSLAIASTAALNAAVLTVSVKLACALLLPARSVCSAVSVWAPLVRPAAA